MVNGIFLPFAPLIFSRNLLHSNGRSLCPKRRQKTGYPSSSRAIQSRGKPRMWISFPRAPSPTLHVTIPWLAVYNLAMSWQYAKAPHCKNSLVLLQFVSVKDKSYKLRKHSLFNWKATKCIWSTRHVLKKTSQGASLPVLKPCMFSRSHLMDPASWLLRWWKTTRTLQMLQNYTGASMLLFVVTWPLPITESSTHVLSFPIASRFRMDHLDVLLAPVMLLPCTNVRWK